jgi:5-methylcytosine-specific restriction protein B
VTDFTRFVQILAEDLVPLLEEYCYEDYGALAQILGSGLVDAAGQRIRQELFSPGKKAELVQALIEPAPDIVTASAATNAAEEPEEATPEEQEETAEAEESKV